MPAPTSHANKSAEREADLAEEKFLLAAQVEMQRMLNKKGLRYKDLAHRLGVSEARVSQLFGDDANNLTIRTIAKIFYRLGETPVLTTERALCKQLLEARGEATPSGGWLVIDTTGRVDVGLGSKLVEEIDVPADRSRRPSELEWANAEGAFQARNSDVA